MSDLQESPEARAQPTPGAPPDTPHHAVGRTVRAIRMAAGVPGPHARPGPRLCTPGDEWASKLEAPASPALANALADLRVVLARHTCRLREEGLPPERMLPQVKRLVRDAMSAEGWNNPDAADALLGEAVRWSIAAYYDLDG